jgi:hypothetical protein
MAFFATGSSTIGTLGDYMGVLNAVLIIPLLIVIGRMTMSKHGPLGLSVKILGILGTVIRLVGGFLLISGILAFEQEVAWEYVGAGFIGVAILIYSVLLRNNSQVSPVYVWFSIVFAVAMTSNFIGLAFPDSLNQLLQGSMSFSDANPLLVISIFVASPIYLLGYPIWLFWTGLTLLRLQKTILAT